MKKILLLCTVLLITVNVKAQDTLFIENFQTTSNSFTLNTADVSSAANGYNQWIINNQYNGGNGSTTCFGIPFTFTIPSTSNQPSGIATSPNSSYLHMVSTSALAGNVGNCNFQAADGLCNAVERNFTKMSADMNTSPYDSVSLSFWWLCSGSNNNYGEVYYSTDGGITWTLINTPFQKYNNQSNWTQQNITLSAFAHQSTLRFGFRFVNQVSTTASDPGFAIDDMLITGSVLTGINTIPVNNFNVRIEPNPFNENLHFNISAFNSYNMFSVSLIDMYGKIILSQQVNAPDMMLNTTNISAGVYFLRVKNGKEDIIQKMIKVQ